jgi:hypothetical protein
MHVVFSTLGPPNINADGNVYYLMSPDGGNFWTSPQKISNVTDPKNVVSTDPHLAIDSRGELFAVWAEARNVTFWRERAIFFTKSNDNGENWEVPIIVSEPNPTQELWEAAPTIGIDVEDNIHLVWTCGNVTNRCYRYSSNHGASWEQIERILTPFESLAGWDSMIVTPIGDLYLLAQMRQPMNVYYSVKPLNGNWIGPTPISNNPEIQDAHFLESTSDGERLFVVFQQSDAEGPIWYTEGWLTNKISFPLIPEFTTTSQIVSTITPQTQTNEPTNSPSPKVTIRDFGDSAPTQWPLIISVITPVLLIVSILLLKHFLGIHKNN